MLVVKAQIKEVAKGPAGEQLSVSGDFADALDKKVSDLVCEACKRAKANGRNTIMPKDLQNIFNLPFEKWGLMEYKQVILVRSDLKLPPGKLASQTAHASVESVLRCLKKDKKIVENWRKQGMKKVVLKVLNLEELHKFNDDAKSAGIVSAVITDAGRTVVAPGTITCLGIGPAPEEKINKLTGSLKMI